MGRRTLLSLVVAIGGGAAACLLPKVDDLSGGMVDGGASDTAADAPARCDATFCDDFDEAPLGAKWLEFSGVDSGYLSLGTLAASPPNALRISFPDAGGGSAQLRTILPIGSRIRCDFALRADVLPLAGQGGDIFVVDYAGTGTVLTNQVRLELDRGGLCIREDVTFVDGGCGCPNFRTPPVAIASGYFVPIGLEVDFTSVRLYLNGALATSHAITTTKPESLAVRLGIEYARQTLLAHVDDFRCTVSP